MQASGTITAYLPGKGVAVSEQPHSDDWLTVSEISELTGYDTSTLRYLAINEWSQEREARKSGATWLIRYGRVLEHIDNHPGPRDPVEDNPNL